MSYARKKFIFGPILGPFGPNESFPEKLGSVMHKSPWKLNFMQNMKKNNEPIPRKIPDSWTDGRTDKPKFIEAFWLASDPIWEENISSGKLLK